MTDPQVEATVALSQFQGMLRFTSVDVPRNRRRFYELRWETSLFGEPVLARTYGRLGTGGRVRADIYPDRERAQQDVVRLIRLRLRHGYQVEEIDWHRSPSAEAVLTEE